MTPFCCEKMRTKYCDYSLKLEHEDKEFKYFFQFSPYIKQPFKFVSSRIFYCPWCGQKLKT